MDNTIVGNGKGAARLCGSSGKLVPAKLAMPVPPIHG